MDVDSAADELYALVPEDFTARRDELAKQARGAGDRPLAGQIKALRKPTAVAWLANQLARHEAADLGALLALGGELRQASASLTGADLRTLSRQRSAVVQALVRQARTLARSLGRPASETVVRELEQTLLVALADPLLADLLESGRLTERLVSAGFGDGPPSVAVSAMAPPGPPEHEPPGGEHPDRTESDRARAGRAARARAQHERELATAWQAASAAKDADDAARTAAEEAARLVEQARAVVVDRRRQLAEAEQEMAAAQEAAESASADQRQTAANLNSARTEVTSRQRDSAQDAG